VLRRSLPLAALAAAVFALVPGTASATPEQAPVENIFSASYMADVEVVLPDGRHANVTLGEYRGASQDGWSGSLSLRVWSESPCYGGYTCQTGMTSAYTGLTEDQVDFRRSLAAASATDIPVTLERWSWTPGSGMTRTEEHVTVSVQFTGDGPVERDTYRGDTCGDGGRECQSIRVSAHRAASASVSLGDQLVVGKGSISYGHGVDAAAPKYEEEGVTN
jgi:hypothetical protein